ncbi:MAG: nitroreductase [Gemmatimonadetes bacterium]|nr:nitroreductase [Gemmatimonadota bacterium]
MGKVHAGERVDVFEAMGGRRSIKRFTPRPVSREEIERALERAVQAPNHRMTEPWGFLVLGAAVKRRYAEVLGRRKGRKVEDPAAAAAVREKTLEDVMAVPAVVAVTTRLDPDPEIREEDYAATFMAIQNILLSAAALGLGTHLRTGAVLQDPELRQALGVAADRRVVALIYLGEPAEVPLAKQRTPAVEKTAWLP